MAPSSHASRRVATWVVVVVVALLIAVTVAALVAASPRVQKLRPIAVSTLGLGGDPNVIVVLVEWRERDLCPSEFTVRASETDSEVSIFEVEHVALPLPLWSGCAGVETVDDRAAVFLTLQQPLADRAVLRAADRTPLPIVRR